MTASAIHFTTNSDPMEVVKARMLALKTCEQKMIATTHAMSTPALIAKRFTFLF